MPGRSPWDRAGPGRLDEQSIGRALGQAGEAIAALGIGRRLDALGRVRSCARCRPAAELHAGDRPAGVLVADDPLDRLGRRRGVLEPAGVEDDRPGLVAMPRSMRRGPPARRGSSRRAWVVAIVGPEMSISAIRSRPIPVRRNRPSGPVVAGDRRRQPCEAVPGALTMPRSLTLRCQVGQVAVLGEPERSTLTRAPATGPTLQVDDPALDRRAVLDQPDRQLARGAGA